MTRISPVRRIVALMLLLLAGAMAPRAHAAGPGDDLLAKTLAAHGGLERWQARRTFSYVLDGFPLSPQVAETSRSTVDLRTRANRIEADGFVVGWDGTQAWSTPGPDAVGLPPRFFALGSFYFVGMPFVFADPGTVIEDKGYADFAGRSYRVLNVGYRDQTGYSSADDYTVFIDPDTGRLALINHSVTETGVERVTWVFDEWQEIDGLLVPARMTFHAGWNPDDPGDGAVFTIREASFDTAAPSSRLYAKPDGAVVDDSPAVH